MPMNRLPRQVRAARSGSCPPGRCAWRFALGVLVLCSGGLLFASCLEGASQASGPDQVPGITVTANGIPGIHQRRARRQ